MWEDSAASSSEMLWERRKEWLEQREVSCHSAGSVSWTTQDLKQFKHVVQHALVDFHSALALGGNHHKCRSIRLKTEVNLVSPTLGGLRERVNNDGHSRCVYHPQCIAVMHLVQENTLLGGSNVRKTSLSDSFSVSVFLIYLIGLYRSAYMCSLA